MTGRLQGKVAIVTGGASGIGAACCRRFSEEGAQVVLTEIQENLGQRVAAEVGGWFVRQDVTQEMTNCVVFLASDESRFVTGSELLADGGWLAEGGIRNLPKTGGGQAA
ncbi:SDR family oxidoreductase [Noviherbaspirillum sedimenti]|uniref:SDR family oxidoreductase n=1 Tax=Noviherbaspirillum sedimenti TaxID=2320865 RepID=A0A3A3G4B6_9BURK|nr:SDR family oxidoreductase [Noviherbaspirillum sedimenti]RJG03333.1 SDR family oxidoreductase [Noviherbaspirillum sedimenti]